MKKKVLSLLCSALIFSAALAGCGNTSAALDGSKEELQENKINNITSANSEITNLTDHVAAENNSADTDIETLQTDAVAVTDFSLRLFNQSAKEGENTLISPLSVLYALGMTANGADEETLVQMEKVFGMSRQELNSYLYVYGQSLPQRDKCKLSLANSIWIKDDIGPAVQEDFLQSTARWYDSQVYQAPFDESTLNEINGWVDENTDGMIPNILNEIPPDAILYLINALAFDAEWENIYKENEIRDSIFTTADGTEQAIEMMYSDEDLYLEDEHAVGFVKYYDSEDFAFVALLPEEGISVTDYISSLTGEHLQQLLSDPQNVEVHAAIPKFECEYDVEMSDILQSMGMKDAFDPDTADFSSMGSTEDMTFCISRVLHKTYIAVDEKGTKAGAATAVEIRQMSALLNIEAKTVYLDRPFVYMLIDCRQDNLPIFIGTLEHVHAI